MSAKQTYAKPPTIPPQLPPELWLEVFKFATWVPDILNPDLMLLDFYRSIPTRERLRLVRASSVTKCSLVRVCKLWNSLASRLLYENIIIGRARVLASVCEALECSDRHADKAGNTSLGWWTKRLDIAMRGKGHFYEGLGIGPPGSEQVARIVQYLPNLSIVTFHVDISDRQFTSSYLDGRILRSLALSCGNTLQIIHWFNDKLPPRESDWSHFLASAPQLRSIRCPTTLPLVEPPPVNTDLQGPSLLALPHLENLFLYHGTRPIFNGPRSGEPLFPSLRRLVRWIGMDPPSREGWDSWAFILRTHGALLTSIHLQIYCGITFGSLSLDLGLISEACPNLTRIDMLFSSWPYFVGRISLPATVSTFGIGCRDFQATSMVYQTLFDGLQSMQISPALKVIQFFRRGNVADLHRKHRSVCMRGVNRLALIGLTVVDDEGRVLR